MYPRRVRAVGVLLSIFQVITLTLKSTLNIFFAFVRKSRKRRRCMRELQSSCGRVRGVEHHPWASRRQRQRWHALAGMRFPRRYWVYPTSSDWWENFVIGIWSDEQWLKNFRMSRSTFMGLVSVLQPRLERQSTVMRSPVATDKRVAAAIWYLANNSTYREVGNQFGLGLSTVGETVVEVCLCIELELYSSVVCLGDGIGKIMDGIARLGVPHCIAAVDGTHIAIRAPGGKINEYGDRKRYCSVLLQGTVDDRGRFIDSLVGYSGRCNDAYVFTNSDLCSAMDAGLFVPGNPTITLNGVVIPAVILGDGAYPMRRWMMTPYRTPRTRVERYFNRKQSSARNVVERAFGRLKARWRVLSKRMNVSIDNVIPIITACVVLHNICEERGHDVFMDAEEQDTMVLPDLGLQNTRAMNNRHLEEGKRVRDALANFMYERRLN